MNITRVAIDNNRLTLTLLFVVIVIGIFTFEKMPRAYDPGFIIRTAQVVTYFPGASPERVENLVTSQIEDVVKEISELDFVTSESRTGVSIVNINIKESYKKMRPIWDDLRRKIEDVETDLPSGIRGPYVNDEFGDVFGIVLTITGEGFDYAQLNHIADDVQSELQRLPEAAKVEIFGDQDERVFVEYDNAQLAELGISPSQLANFLEARNIVISGGAFDLGKERISLEPSGNFESIDEIRHTIIHIPGSTRLLYLKDIAKIYRGYIDPPTSLTRASGQEAIALAISMREGGNNIVLGDQVIDAVNRLQEQYPWGIDFDLVNFSPAEVDKKVSEFVGNLLQAIAVVTVVMLLTLGFRTGLIVSLLIPITMLLAIMVMHFFNIGFDQISLAALIIALGMLVDNGIVMSESILVQMENGKKALNAAIDTATELRVPLLTASLTTGAAFLPIYLAESNVGEFTASLFTVVTITLLCSWLIALTIIPMLCVTFLKVTPKQKHSSPATASDSASQHAIAKSPILNLYANALYLLLRFRITTLVVTVVVFCCSLLLIQFIPKAFFPPSDRAYFKVEFELPQGSTFEATQTAVESIEDLLANTYQIEDENAAGVTNWISYIGNAGPRFILSHNPKPSNNSYALMIVNVNNVERIPEIMQGINQFAREHHPDLDIKTRYIETGPAVENPVEVRLSGADKKMLPLAVDELKEKLVDMGQLQNISDNWGQRIKKLDVDIDQARALRAGISSQDIAVSLQSGLSGLNLTEYRENEDIIPVVLRSNVATQSDINKVESLSVYSQSQGKSLPLKQVADINLVWDRSRIYRRNGVRTVTVGAQLKGDVTAAEKFDELVPWLESKKDDWQGKVRYELGGESESSSKANESIMAKLPIAGFIILILLVAQFNSIRKSLIVITTIPLGLIGVILGLFFTQSFFGFMTLLGIVSLAGIVINNAIVLLERIQIEIDAGLAPLDAIIEAAQQRFRPILLTTATTVLGLLPLYLGGGEMWEPMAISIMAGLLFSTLLTLGLVPVLYAVLYRIAPQIDQGTKQEAS
ncbi:Multidrug resistance protein MdtB [Thalassocella blandensis]|nr:Multidrug resistance protein MdtB [Thalassocella blandensis]